MDIEQKIKKLTNKINHHNIQYYVYDNPVVSDYDYDILFRELQQLELEYPQFICIDSPTNRIGSTPLDKFNQINHRIPLLSLSNAMNSNELELFNTQMEKGLTSNNIEYIGEPKLDGLAVELIYEDGQFIKGSTRGNGYIGEDITENLKTIRAIPLFLYSDYKIPKILEVRGEVFINHYDFEQLNKQRADTGESIFANPRNCAAGSLRQLDSSVTATRPLRIYCYAPGYIEDLSIQSQKEFLEILPKWGFPVNTEIQLGKGIKFLNSYYNHIESIRNSLKYDIDGVVFKINSYASQRILGERSRSPRWAIAAKLKPVQATSLIKDIIPNVGRTGAITPVAKLDSVNVGGVMVSNATLHNQDEINKKDIQIGDTVIIQRAGDVIPEVVKVIKEKRKLNSQPYILPSTCPSCNEPVSRIEDEAIMRCLNINCPAQLEGKIKHFVSKNYLDIDGLGEKIVQLLIHNKLIVDISDIFTLNHEQLSVLDRLGDKSSINIINSINKSKKTTMSRFIHGLGIRNIGEHLSKILEHRFNSKIDNLIAATFDELIDIDEVGEIVANSIIKYFRDESNLRIINKCFELGLVFTASIQTSIILDNKFFVLTGTLPSLSRQEAKGIIEDHGGKVSSSISMKTDFLLCGDNPGSKYDKAQKFNIKIIDEDQLKELINEPT